MSAYCHTGQYALLIYAVGESLLIIYLLHYQNFSIEHNPIISLVLLHTNTQCHPLHVGYHQILSSYEHIADASNMFFTINFILLIVSLHNFNVVCQRPANNCR